MIRILGHIIEETRVAPSRERLVIGWAQNGAPRTYRLARPPAWPTRLARAVLTSLS